MLEGLRQATLMDEAIAPPLRVMWPIPTKAASWGVLEPLKQSAWGKQIPIVTGEVWSLALHGRTRPLRLLLGSPPRVRANRLPVAERACIMPNCVLRGVHCIPGSGKLPNCYQPQSPELRRLQYAVGMAWDEGRYVIVVEGSEFVL